MRVYSMTKNAQYLREWAKRERREERNDLPVLEGVEFRPAPGWKGYAVGDDGSVWTCRRTNGKCDGPWKRMKPSFSGCGYLRVSLLSGSLKTMRYRYVHRLVLEAFVGPPTKQRSYACHFPDPDKTNNKLTNLMWGSHQENVSHAKIHGTHKPIPAFRGTAHYKAKLTDDDVREIRRIWAAGEMNGPQLAKRYGVDKTNISGIVRRVTWRHLED